MSLMASAASVGNGNSYYITSGILQGLDLPDGSFDIGSLCVCHRLDGYRAPSPMGTAPTLTCLVFIRSNAHTPDPLPVDQPKDVIIRHINH